MHHSSLLVTTLGALALGATVFCLAAPAQAGMSVSRLGAAAASALHQVSDRCQMGFHEISAPNGNGYRCVEDHR